MKTLRCIVVDDEPLAVKMLEGYISRTPFLELEASFNDPVEALGAIRSSAPELVFLDIQMPDLDGMELSRMLPYDTRVIFTTAFKQYAFESYEVSALDFLLKPIRYQKFLEAVQKAREWFSLKESALARTGEKQDIYIKADGVLVRVPLENILYVEGMKDYVIFHLSVNSGTLVSHLTMKAAEEMLPSGRFMRIHRSFIVALDRIETVSPAGDISIGDRLLHVSEGYSEAFGAYLKMTGAKT